jgi:uroporphyrinogen III methyltransferase/synthase
MSKVYLVGAGPGDPGLLTCRGREVLSRADCVLYDHLANDALLAIAPPGAERIYVGKKKSEHTFTQEEISALLVERARRGWTVVRLKGGDPFIFGRGGEEAEALAAAAVPFEIVPGVTAPLGIAAYSGVPLTHRGHTSVVTFVTGHGVESIDWAKVGTSETLVIFMGLTHIGNISREIIQHGRSPETPAMAVRWGTYPWQETIAGTLGDIAGRIDTAGMKPPATVIIGEVVKLRETLNWYENLPLFGKSIVVTRASEQGKEMAATLRALGADAVELPVISLEPPEDSAPLDDAIARLGAYDWLIFTSAAGVHFFLERLDASPHDFRGFSGRLCAIGPATRRELEALHLKVDLMPEAFVAESLVEAFSKEDLRGKRILLPRAAEARELLPESLRHFGARVDVVPAYRNVIPAEARARAAKIFAGGKKPHWVTFTSSSTVRNFLDVAGAAALDGVRTASIGPVTSATLRENGIAVAAEACEFTSDGLIAAVIAAG